MNVRELKKLVEQLPDDTPVEINSVYNHSTDELEPSEISECHYDEKREAVFMTPLHISL